MTMGGGGQKTQQKFMTSFMDGFLTFSSFVVVYHCQGETLLDRLMHYSSLFWKICCAIVIPPPGNDN